MHARRAPPAPPTPGSDGSWILDKRQLHTVRIVGALREEVTDIDQTRVLLDVSDGTGAASLTYFPDPDDTVWAHTRGGLSCVWLRLRGD